MSSDLLQLTQNYFIGSTVRQICAAFQESESSVSTALRDAVPVVLNALIARTQQPGGAADVFGRVYRVHRRKPLADFDGLLSEVTDSTGPTPALDGSLPGPGAGLLRTALGQHYAPTVAGISRQASLPPDTVGQLLSLVAAVELALLGRYAVEHTLDARGLASYLASQHAPIEEVAATEPTEWGSGRAAGAAAAANVQAPPASRPAPPDPTPVAPPALTPFAPPAPVVVSASVAPPAPAPVAPAPTADTPPLAPPTAPPRPVPPPRPVSEPAAPAAATHRRWPWLLALLLVIVLAIAAAQLYFLHEAANPAAPTTAPAAAQTAAATAPRPTDLPEGAGSNHLAYIAGHTTLRLPGRPLMRVSNNSAEGRLYNFLHDPNQIVSLDKTQGWVLLDQVHFKPGTTALTPEALGQVRTLAILLKAFPRVAIKLGGYTDDQASTDQNLLISADCANAIRRLLLAHKIAPGRVAAEGYGQAPTRTAPPAGPSQSRRVYVRVVKKY